MDIISCIYKSSDLQLTQLPPAVSHSENAQNCNWPLKWVRQGLLRLVALEKEVCEKLVLAHKEFKGTTHTAACSFLWFLYLLLQNSFLRCQKVLQRFTVILAHNPCHSHMVVFLPFSYMPANHLGNSKTAHRVHSISKSLNCLIQTWSCRQVYSLHRSCVLLVQTHPTGVCVLLEGKSEENKVSAKAKITSKLLLPSSVFLRELNRPGW